MLKRDLDDGEISKTKEILEKKWDVSLFFSLHQQWVLSVITLLLLGSLCFSFFYHPPSPSSEELVREVVIEVSGEVQSPGVYLFQYSPTLREAVERAGGLKETVQFDGASSSETLETGTLLTVARESYQLPSFPPPSKGEYGKTKREEIKIRISRMAADKCLVFSIPLDLNRISIEDLCLIPGIGESLAREMITYRKRRGGFRSVEDLKNVRGIGEKKYQNLKGFFTTR
jgi:competence ComEA-like helix-hairpin-helix protein